MAEKDVTFNGEALRQLREERGWSQRELARRARVTQATVSGLETGGRPHPSTDTFGRIGMAFGGGDIFGRLLRYSDRVLAANEKAIRERPSGG